MITNLLAGLALASCVAVLVAAWMLAAERTEQRRARTLERLDDEPQPSALVACQRCGVETRVLNGVYVVACGCEP